MALAAFPGDVDRGTAFRRGHLAVSEVALKRFITTMSLILAIALTAGGPAILAQKSTPEPTPLPSPATEEKQPPPAPTPTPEPASGEKATPLPTPTPTSTAKPPALPTPTSEPAHSTPTNTATPRPTNTPAPTTSPNPTSTSTPVPLISGLVYDDRNGDGIRGPDEPGVGGVAVTLDGQVVGATDTGGRFSLPLPGPGRALLAIVPPAGWQWTGEPVVADGALDDVAIPLHRLEPAEATTTAATTMAAGSVALALLFLAFTGATSLLQVVAVRSLTRTYRQQKAQEMEYRQDQVITRRKAEVEQLLADDAGNWRQVVAQILADALPGADTAWLTVADVSTTPVPRFDVVGEDGKRYTFTVSPARGKGRVISLDASLSPAMRVEVQTVWKHLAEHHGLDLQLLPRRAEWYLVVQRRKKRRARREGE